jgi:hypothetical protein
MTAPSYVDTDDPTDPCALCVQWRLIDPADELGSDWEPYWPDGTVPPRIWRGTHADCQAAVDQMHADQEAARDRAITPRQERPS